MIQCKFHEKYNIITIGSRAVNTHTNTRRDRSIWQNTRISQTTTKTNTIQVDRYKQISLERAKQIRGSQTSLKNKHCDVPGF